MNWWQRFKRSTAHTQANIVCTAIIMLATIAYSVIAFFQLRAMRRQIDESSTSLQQTLSKMQAQVEAANKANELSLKIISGTEGAFISPPPIDMEQDQVVIRLHNFGKVPARNVTANIEVTRQILPEYRRVGGTQSFILSVPEVQPGSIEVIRKLTLKGFTQRDEADIEAGRTTITVSGIIVYDNGFGVTTHQLFCNAHLYVQHPDGHIGGGGWPDCQNVPLELKMALPPEQRWPDHHH